MNCHKYSSKYSKKGPFHSLGITSFWNLSHNFSNMDRYSLMDLINMMISSKYGSVSFHLSVARIIFGSSWNLLAELFRRGAFVRNLSSPLCDWNVAFRVSCSFILIYGYPQLALTLENMHPSPTESRHLFVPTTWEAYSMVTAIIFLQSIQSLEGPDLFETNSQKCQFCL